MYVVYLHNTQNGLDINYSYNLDVMVQIFSILRCNLNIYKEIRVSYISNVIYGDKPLFINDIGRIFVMTFLNYLLHIGNIEQWSSHWRGKGVCSELFAPVITQWQCVFSSWGIWYRIVTIVIMQSFVQTWHTNWPSTRLSCVMLCAFETTSVWLRYFSYA